MTDDRSTATRRPVIQFISNQVPGWSHTFGVREVARVTEDRFDVRLDFKEDVDEALLATADILVPMDLGVLHRVQDLGPLWRPHRDKIVFWLTSDLPTNPRGRTAHLQILGQFSAAIIVGSPILDAAVSPYVDVPVVYSPRGTDTRLFSPGPGTDTPDGRLVVGWAGSTGNMGRFWRGLHLLEAAVEQVDGVELRIRDREAGRLPREEMPDWYRGLDVLVCASQSEGGPGPPVEAAACGVPAISTRVGYMPDFIVDGLSGLLVDRTVGALTDALRDLRDHPIRRRAMGRYARRIAEGWDVEQRVEPALLAFQAVLDGELR